MIETSHKYGTKIAMGGCIAELDTTDTWNCSRTYNCQTG